MSKRLIALKKEVEVLRDQFLPAPFDPLGVYPDSDRVQAHTRAFLVLSHAAFETYLEEGAREIARAAEDLWKRTGRMAPPLAFLLGSLSARVRLPQKLPTKGSKDGPHLLAEEIGNLFQTFYTSLRTNNGIKEANVLKMFGPLGVPATAFNATLLPNLDALGSARGEHAHNSVKAVKSVLDPEDQYKRLNTLLQDLAGLDKWITDCKRRVR